MTIEILYEPLTYFILGGFLFYIIGVIMNILLVYGAVRVVSKSFADVSSRIPLGKILGSWFSFAISLGEVSTLIEVRMNKKLIDLFKGFGIDIQILSPNDLVKKYQEEKEKYEKAKKKELTKSEEVLKKEETKKEAVPMDDLNKKLDIAEEILRARKDGDRLKEYEKTKLLRYWEDFDREEDGSEDDEF